MPAIASTIQVSALTGEAVQNRQLSGVNLRIEKRR
jgi:hypothetical protein